MIVCDLCYPSMVVSDSVRVCLLRHVKTLITISSRSTVVLIKGKQDLMSNCKNCLNILSSVSL